MTPTAAKVGGMHQVRDPCWRWRLPHFNAGVAAPSLSVLADYPIPG